MAQAPQLPKKPGFGAGISALWGGVGWLAKTPGAWPLAAVPIGLTIVLFAVLGWLGLAYIPDLVDGMMGSSTVGGFVEVLFKIIIGIVVVIAAAFVGFTLAQPLSGSAMEGLVEKHEAALGHNRPKTNTGFFVDLGRSLKSLLVSYMFGIPALIILFALGLLMPAAEIVLFPAKLFVAAVTVAWDFCDFPLTLRSIPIGKRISVIFRNFGAVLGFSLGLALAGLVPCLLFFLLPGGVAGAARLMVEIERYEASQGKLITGDPHVGSVSPRLPA